MNTFEVRSFLSNILIDLLTNEKPDERQIMTYVSCYYHAFQGAMQVELRVPRHVTSPDDGKTCCSDSYRCALFLPPPTEIEN